MFFGAAASGGVAGTDGGAPLGAETRVATGAGIRATVEECVGPLGALRRATVGRAFQTCAWRKLAASGAGSGAANGRRTIRTLLRQIDVDGSLMSWSSPRSRSARARPNS